VWVRIGAGPDGIPVDQAIDQFPDAWMFKSFGATGRDWNFHGKAFRTDVLETDRAKELLARVLAGGVTAAGQFSWLDKRILAAALKKGLIAQGKGGPYPRIKTCYGAPGTDFAVQRAAFIAATITLDRRQSVAA
jgi:hypothetical protein